MLAPLAASTNFYGQACYAAIDARERRGEDPSILGSTNLGVLIEAWRDPVGRRCVVRLALATGVLVCAVVAWISGWPV